MNEPLVKDIRGTFKPIPNLDIDRVLDVEESRRHQYDAAVFLVTKLQVNFSGFVARYEDPDFMEKYLERRKKLSETEILNTFSSHPQTEKDHLREMVLATLRLAHILHCKELELSPRPKNWEKVYYRQFTNSCFSLASECLKYHHLGFLHQPQFGREIQKVWDKIVWLTELNQKWNIDSLLERILSDRKGVQKKPAA